MMMDHNNPTAPSLPEDPDQARKQRERDFHNKEFSTTGRKAADVAYGAAATANRRFLERALKRARGSVVLEYGCGPGTYSFQYADVASRVVGIDISDTAVDRARARAAERGTTNTEFHRMDCESPDLPPASFDLICGRAILHHLDLDRSFSTIRRLLKPGGSALFLEPLGHNPAVNLFRRLTPSMRTVDEHPLLRRDLATARRYFDQVDVEPFAMLTVFAAPLLKVPGFSPVFRAIEFADRGLLRLPGVRWQGWTSIWSFK
jgi:SAM-dependent methyltransferase